MWIIFNSSFVLEIWVGELFLDYCWGGYLAHFWLHESDSSFGNTYFWHFFDVSRLLYLWNLCTTRVEHDCWRNISFNMRRCRSHDMSSFSHIPKRKIAPSLWTRYMGVGLRTIYQVFNVLNTASATHNYPGCCGTTCARIAMQRYVRHAAWMNGYSCHVAFCHRSHNVVCFVLPSCCTTAGSDPIALLPNTLVHCMAAHNK